MEFSKFAEQAILRDERNVFAPYSGSLDGIPKELINFYREADPVDVEVDDVRFYPVEELEDLQAEYAYLNAQFVFATSNGDPIFLQDGCVYTAPHGVEEPTWELLAKDIGAYLSSLVLE